MVWDVIMRGVYVRMLMADVVAGTIPVFTCRDKKTVGNLYENSQSELRNSLYFFK